MKVGLTFACMNLKKLAKMKARKGLLEEEISLSNVILDVIRFVKEKWLWSNALQSRFVYSLSTS